MEKTTSKATLRRFFGKKNKMSFHNSLQMADWSFLAVLSDISMLADKFIDIITNPLNKIFPLRKYHVKSKPPVTWYNDSLRSMKETLSAVKTVCAVTNCPEDLAVFKTMEKQYSSALTTAKKKSYELFLSTSTNFSKDSWKLIHFERSKCLGNTKIDQNLTSTAFNQYFCNIAKDIICVLS
ncbi:hypothetical protein JTB14_002564 [Gonioctena quinquepunctata]|nr:hypothetical protein JTB14_002564 [Gonioctena quinquepunctata]